MFARQLVHAPFQGLPQPEIIPVQRQHLMLSHGVREGELGAVRRRRLTPEGDDKAE
jgi:hypothetical protein